MTGFYDKKGIVPVVCVIVETILNQRQNRRGPLLQAAECRLTGFGEKQEPAEEVPKVVITRFTNGSAHGTVGDFF